MALSHLTPHPTIAGAGITGTMGGWQLGHILGATGTLHDVLPVLIGGAFSLVAATLGHMRRRDVLDIKTDIHDLGRRVGRVEDHLIDSLPEE